MAVTAAMVKELREMTGAGMMDCKKALTATEGDMDAAVEFLRKNGQAKAEKKAGRIAAEGLCRIAVKDEGTAAVVEVNSETDFVAKNEKFQDYVAEVAAQTEMVPLDICGIPDEDVPNGTDQEVFKYYKMDVQGIKDRVKILISKKSK